ncbi:MAG TPA: hypothetical protein VGG33_20760 [Polyangia bacterium]
MLTPRFAKTAFRWRKIALASVCLCAALTFFAVDLLGFSNGFRAHAQALPAPPAFQIVVHGDHPEDSIDGRFLARAFLKKSTTWPDGSTVRPVDQRMDSRVRQRFSEVVLQRSVVAVRNYWQQLIFTGRAVPPPELDSDDAVIRYVLRYRGAVGYVAGTANVGSAKVLRIR